MWMKFFSCGYFWNMSEKDKGDIGTMEENGINSRIEI